MGSKAVTGMASEGDHLQAGSHRSLYCVDSLVTECPCIYSVVHVEHTVVLFSEGASSNLEQL